MRVSKALVGVAVLGQVLLVLVLQDGVDAAPQEAALDLPVQLLGFPAIIIAVRLSNFVKKLAYSLNPRTYTGRVRRAALAGLGDELIDMAEAEKRLVEELGEDVCVYTRVCLQYAHRAQRNKNRSTRVLDWEHILRQYKRSPDKNKEFYLLSVFLGDIVASPRFCQQLAKRGRACADE